jgi:hypothetical protein
MNDQLSDINARTFAGDHCGGRRLRTEKTEK